MSFPFYKQLDAMDCGPTCLRMITKHFGRSYSLGLLREWCYIEREGVSLLGISDAAERVGLRTMAVKINYTLLCDEAPLPCIVHWNQNHFVTVYKINKTHVWVADPASGQYKLKKEEFLKSWTAEQLFIAENDTVFMGSNTQNAPIFIEKALLNDEKQGIALLIEPTPAFLTDDEYDDFLLKNSDGNDVKIRN